MGSEIIRGSEISLLYRDFWGQTAQFDTNAGTQRYVKPMYKNFTNQSDYNQSLEKQKSPGKPGFASTGRDTPDTQRK